MSLFKHYKSANYEWGIWKLDEDENKLLSNFSIEDRQKYLLDLQNFKSESRKREWLAVRALLFELLGEVKEISYESNGKPYFSDHSFHLSISHTKGYVAVIISKDHVVGIDIEQYGERVRKIAHKFVRDDEYPDAGKDISTQSLLLIWSAKEVMFKCMSAQDVDFREHLFVRLPVEESLSMFARECRTPFKYEFFIDYFLHTDFVMTWTAI